MHHTTTEGSAARRPLDRPGEVIELHPVTPIVAGEQLDFNDHPYYDEPWTVASSVRAFTDLCLQRGVRWDGLTYGGPRPPVDGWRASDLGYCRRKSFYGRQQAERDEDTDAAKGKFAFGHMIEAVVVAALQADPRVEWLDSQTDLYSERLNLHGHCDGRIRVHETGEVLVIECKSMNGNAFRYSKEWPKPYHRLQAGSYLLMFEEMGEEADRSRIVYISKDNWQIKEYGVSLTDRLRVEIETEVEALTELWEAERLPRRLPATRREIKRGPRKGQIEVKRAYKCSYCPFESLCYTDPD